MKHAHIVANESLPHHASWGGAFADGLRQHGWLVTSGDGPIPCDLMVIWGVRHRKWIEAQQAAGGKVCVLERGYVGDRFVWTSVSFGGGLNGRGVFNGPMHDGSRWDKHFAHLMRPWRKRGAGSYALLIGQVPGDMSLGGRDLRPWYEEMAAALNAGGWRVLYRPHPRTVELGLAGSPPAAVPTTLKAGYDLGSLESALCGAGLVVTWNSNTAVESVLGGVPTIAMDEGSMAWPVTGHAVGELVTPDRTEWAHRLAWCQWSREEMVSGDCWAAVGA